MQKILTALTCALCVILWSAPAAARTETITGQVVDLNCLNLETKANAGMDHVPQGRECAWACARWWGQPVGILTADGKVYQLTGGLVADNNAKIAPHVTHTVTITGDVTEKDGMTMLAANDLTMVKAPTK